RPAITPRDRYNGPRITPHNSLQRQFDRQVEVRREKRPAPVQCGLAICFEGVRCIVKWNSEQKPYEEISHAIEYQFDPRVIDHAATLHESASESAIPAIV